jgi:hypothetical protein
MANKTITIDNITYILAPLTFGQGKAIFRAENKAADINTPLLCASLNNVDQGERTDAYIDAIPYSHAMQLLPEILELNGLKKPGEGKPGEDQPATV